MKKKALVCIFFATTIATGNILPEAALAVQNNFSTASHIDSTAEKPDVTEPTLIALGWGSFAQGMITALGAITSVLAIQESVQARVPSTCPSSNGEFPITQYNTWFGHFNGYAVALDTRGFIAVGFPNGVIDTTGNIFRGAERNQWYALSGTPYAYCINSSNNTVRVRYEY